MKTIPNRVGKLDAAREVQIQGVLARAGDEVILVEEDFDVWHQLAQPQLDGAHRLLALRPRVREEDVEAALVHRERVDLLLRLAIAQPL